ncbi:MAG TPA: ATP-binding cassette domain-containing protein [Bacillota bacterium]
MRDPVLAVDRVVKRFGDKTTVDHVSFDVRPGEIMGFLGPNGAGKTTTLRMIMGILAPDQGRITFRLAGGDAPQRGSRHAGAAGTLPAPLVGYLPEERGLYREARVLDILLFLASLKGLRGRAARTRALEWLERFGLGPQAHARVHQLSKGMAQKVQFIGAVLHEPRLVVLDEPFSGLDPVNQELFLNEIRRLAAEGCAVLLSSHQMNLVEELCERIFLIHQGRRVVYGPLRDIKADYGVHRVRLLLRDAGWRLPSSSLVESAEYDGPRATLTLRAGVEPAAFLSSLPPGAPIEEISVARISLHEIFVRIAREEAIA